MTALPRPLPKTGNVKGRWKAHHDRSRLAVMKRCHGMCEAPGCRDAATDWCHLAGRRHIIAEPWCSSPELTCGLCRQHHNAIDRNLDPELLAQLRWKAVERWEQSDQFLAVPRPSDADPLDVIREMGRLASCGFP